MHYEKNFADARISDWGGCVHLGKYDKAGIKPDKTP